jgi:hypothetical protein
MGNNGADDTPTANYYFQPDATVQQEDCVPAKNGEEESSINDASSSRSTLVDDSTHSGGEDDDDLPTVSIDEGAHKFVLVTAIMPSKLPRTFLYSKANAPYHVNVVADLLPKDTEKMIHVSGCSYGFGQADPEVVMQTINQDLRYRSYHVTW